MKRITQKYLTVGFIICIFIMFTACNSSKTTKLIVVNDKWTGVEGNGEEIPGETYVIKKGDVITLGGIENLEIRIHKIGNQSVTFMTNTPMSDKEDGTVNLNTRKTKFIVTKGNPLILDTPTMDAGDSFTFILAEEDA